MFGPLEQFELNYKFLNISYYKWDVATYTKELINSIAFDNLACDSGIDFSIEVAYTFLLFYQAVHIYTVSYRHYILPWWSSFYLIISNNFLVFLILFCFILFFFFYQIFLQYNIIPKIWLFCLHFYCKTIQQIINDLLLDFKGKFYFFSLLFCLFILINFLNLTGLIPYSFAITSYFSITFLFAFIFFFSFICVGIYYHGFKILNLFLPSGTPVIIMPLLILIEFISYFARIFSLSIRLFANITAGHILLKILSWFIFLLFNVFLLSVSGFFLITILWILEFFIAILQSYVFLILLCIYLNEVLTLQH
jgi:F-type H+-transporting ATPase subunit a